MSPIVGSLVIALIITIGLAWCCVMVVPAPNGGKTVDRRSDPAHRTLHRTADDFGVQRETIAIISDSPGTVPGVTILNTTAEAGH